MSKSSTRRKVFSTIEAMETRCLLTSGDLDLSFNRTGKQLSQVPFTYNPGSGDVTNTDSRPGDVYSDPNNVLVVGHGGDGLASHASIALYDELGVLKTSFSTDGKFAFRMADPDVGQSTPSTEQVTAGVIDQWTEGMNTITHVVVAGTVITKQLQPP